MTTDAQIEPAAELARVVRKHISAAVSALGVDALDARLSAVESIAPVIGKDGTDGKDGRDGLDIDLQQVAALVADSVKSIAESLPKPKDGRDGVDGVDGKDGRDGFSPDAKTIAADTLAVLMKALDAIPAAKDGKDGADGINGKDGSDGKNGLDGSDGIHGKDGRNGIDGKDSSADEVAEVLAKMLPAMVSKAVEAATADIVLKVSAIVPKAIDGRDGRDAKDGKDGINGRDGADGRDGLSPDDFDIEIQNERDFVVSMKCGDRIVTKTLRLPLDVDREIYVSGKTYEQGDGVTYGGSYWRARRETDKPPGTDDWRLIAKRGKDGKDGKDGAS